jgi:hypothetical protein
MNLLLFRFLRLTFTTILFGFLLNELSSFSQVNVITERMRSDLVSQQLNDTLVTGYLESLRPDGSWSDVDYANISGSDWLPAIHLRRLLLICCAYNKPESIHFHNVDVKSKICKIIEFYVAYKPKSGNWWWQAIGAPEIYGPALLLMKSTDGFGITQALLESYADTLLEYHNASVQKWPVARTGTNKIWLLWSSINKACIKNNEEELRENFKSVFEEARIMPGAKMGIKNDYSFHFHGPQLYPGGYGMPFMSYISYFATLAAGTPYQMSDIQMKVIADALLDGYRWFIQRSAFDFGAIGRTIARPEAGSSLPLRVYINRFISINAPRSKELTRFVSFINGEVPFQNPGNKHFWRSDIMVQHGRDFYLSAKVPSKRTRGTEWMVGANLKNKWLPWGTTNIMIDGDEYKNIYPVWDWSRIPGVTSAMENVRPLPYTDSFVVNRFYSVSTSEFAGGVSNGILGLAAYDYSWDGVVGRKAWFFTPEAMYCLGAGINASKENPVITSVNQCISSGLVTVKNNKKKINIEGTTISSSGIKWIHHDRIGYLFPGGGDITVKNMDQTGSWSDINQSESTTPVTNKVFSAWISHGNNPSDAGYEYIVVPAKDLSKFNKWMQKNPLKMIINTSEIQAIFDKNENIFGIAFYKAGYISLKEGLIVETDKPCLLLIQGKNNGSYTISISDPTASLSDINIKISKELSGPGTKINPDKSTIINFFLPSGDDAGRSYSYDFSSR